MFGIRGFADVGKLTRAMAVLAMLGLVAGCSAPSSRSTAGYARYHPYHAYPSRGSGTVANVRGSEDIGASTGVASHYSGRAATGEAVTAATLTAAHPTLPFGTRVKVTNPTNGRSVVVRINDRGPFIRNRSIDLSDGAAGTIGMDGVARVKMEVVR
jgi:rare lipoprotein A